MSKDKTDEKEKKIPVTFSLSPEVAKAIRIRGAIQNLTRSSWVEKILREALKNESVNA